MNIEKYTERARGFIQSAQSLAMRDGHQQFSPLHMLKVLLDDSEGLAGGLIDRAGVIHGRSSKLPRTRSTSCRKFLEAARGRSIWRRNWRARSTLRKRAREGRRQFCHGRAAAAGPDAGERQRRWRDPQKGGVTPQNLNAAIEALRKGRTADSATAENAYDALKKYSAT